EIGLEVDVQDPVEWIGMAGARVRLLERRQWIGRGRPGAEAARVDPRLQLRRTIAELELHGAGVVGRRLQARQRVTSLEPRAPRAMVEAATRPPRRSACSHRSTAWRR